MAKCNNIWFIVITLDLWHSNHSIHFTYNHFNNLADAQEYHDKNDSDIYCKRLLTKEIIPFCGTELAMSRFANKLCLSLDKVSFK